MGRRKGIYQVVDVLPVTRRGRDYRLRYPKRQAICRRGSGGGFLFGGMIYWSARAHLIKAGAEHYTK